MTHYTQALAALETRRSEIEASALPESFRLAALAKIDAEEVELNSSLIAVECAAE